MQHLARSKDFFDDFLKLTNGEILRILLKNHSPKDA
jgi:hypothetical protein